MDSYIDVSMQLEELLAPGASPADLKKAQALLKKHSSMVSSQPALRSYVIRVHLMSGDAKKALAEADLQIAADKMGFQAWPHFWRAAALAQLDDPAAMVESLATAYARDKDVAAAALKLEAFKPFVDDPAFLKAIKRAKAPKLDASISRLVKLASEGTPFGLYKAATKLVDAHEDQASVLDALLSALGEIVEDLDEHGDANLDEYGGGKISPAAFRKEMTARKQERKALGRKKSAFATAVARGE